MPKFIKYNIDAESNSITSSDMRIGIKDATSYGPTTITGFYAGITPPIGGYTLYLVKDANGPSIYAPASDEEMRDLVQSISGTPQSTIEDALVWVLGQTGMVAVNRVYEDIITDNLLINLDAGMVASYPKSGSTLYDLTDNGLDFNLVNNPTFSAGATGKDASLSFASGSYADLDITPSSLQGNPGFTIMGFFKRNASYNAGATWGMGGGASLQGINSWNSTSNNEITIDLYGNNTYSTGQTYSDTDWKFVAWRKTAGTSFNRDNITITVDDTHYTGTGLSVIRETGGTGATPNVNTNGFVLNRASANEDNYYGRSIIGNFMVYDTYLTDAQVESNFAALRGKYMYDADAVSFFTLAGITDTALKDIVNAFVLDLKGYGYTPNSFNIWIKIVALWPMVGGTAGSHSINLRQNDFHLTYPNGATHTLTGVKLDGIDQHMYTGLIPRDDVLTAGNSIDQNVTLSVYVDSDVGATAGVLGHIGAHNGNGARISQYENNGNVVSDIFSVYPALGGLSAATGGGGLITSMSTTREHEIYSGGEVAATDNNNQGSIGSTSFFIPLVIGAINENTTNLYHHPGEFRLGMVGYYFNAQEHEDWNYAVQRFQSSLRRNKELFDTPLYTTYTMQSQGYLPRPGATGNDHPNTIAYDFNDKSTLFAHTWRYTSGSWRTDLVNAMFDWSKGAALEDDEKVYDFSTSADGVTVDALSTLTFGETFDGRSNCLKMDIGTGTGSRQFDFNFTGNHTGARWLKIDVQFQIDSAGGTIQSGRYAENYGYVSPATPYAFDTWISDTWYVYSYSSTNPHGLALWGASQSFTGNNDNVYISHLTITSLSQNQFWGSATGNTRPQFIVNYDPYYRLDGVNEAITATYLIDYGASGGQFTFGVNWFDRGGTGATGYIATFHRDTTNYLNVILGSDDKLHLVESIGGTGATASTVSTVPRYTNVNYIVQQKNNELKLYLDGVDTPLDTGSLSGLDAIGACRFDIGREHSGAKGAGDVRYWFASGDAMEIGLAQYKMRRQEL